MIPFWRQKFNKQFSEEKYAAFMSTLEGMAGASIDFRPCETPVFLPLDLKAELEQASLEIIAQLHTREYHQESTRAIPVDFFAPNEGEHPVFVVVDFAITRDEKGKLVPRLIELQGCASLYAFQLELPSAYFTHYDLDSLESILGDLTRSEYLKLFAEVVVAAHDPENVVLMEIEPDLQKTRPDFVLTQKLLGVEPVCITDIEKIGRRLFYQRQGRRTEIRRIYNRVIIDELVRKNIQAPFDFREELDVEWAGHPNWFFRWSKYSLPYLNQQTVPRAWFLSDLDSYPKDLDRFVLKPLFSFAGAGVKVEVSREDLDAIPESDRQDFLLQEKISYDPVIQTPDDPSKVEIRVMFLWPENAPAPTPVVLLTRLSKGLMLGVDFNKNKTWVGSSCALFEKQ